MLYGLVVVACLAAIVVVVSACVAAGRADRQSEEWAKRMEATSGE